jgi:uncharacterized membrane protein YuzA (DUF378 family)
MAEKSALDILAMVLVIIGGLNWGLMALFNLDLVQAILGSIPMLAKAVYVLVGLSALYVLYAQFIRK